MPRKQRNYAFQGLKAGMRAKTYIRADGREAAERAELGCVKDPDVRYAMLEIFRRKHRLKDNSLYDAKRAPAVAARYGHVTESGLATARAVREAVEEKHGPEAASLPHVPHLPHAYLHEVSRAAPPTLQDVPAMHAMALRLLALYHAKNSTVAERAELNRGVAQMIAGIPGWAGFMVQSAMQEQPGKSEADVSQALCASFERVVDRERKREEREEQERKTRLAKELEVREVRLPTTAGHAEALRQAEIAYKQSRRRRLDVLATPLRTKPNDIPAGAAWPKRMTANDASQKVAVAVLEEQAKSAAAVRPSHLGQVRKYVLKSHKREERASGLTGRDSEAAKHWVKSLDEPARHDRGLKYNPRTAGKAPSTFHNLLAAEIPDPLDVLLQAESAPE